MKEIFEAFKNMGDEERRKFMDKYNQVCRTI
jgi:hypothetical protein